MPPIFFVLVRCASPEIIYAAFKAIAQAMNLLSFGSSFIHGRKLPIDANILKIMSRCLRLQSLNLGNRFREADRILSL